MAHLANKFGVMGLEFRGDRTTTMGAGTSALFVHVYEKSIKIKKTRISPNLGPSLQNAFDEP